MRGHPQRQQLECDIDVAWARRHYEGVKEELLELLCEEGATLISYKFYQSKFSLEVEL